MDKETGFSFLAFDLLSSNEVDVMDISGEVEDEEEEDEEDEDEDDNDEDIDEEDESIISLDFELFGHFIFNSGLLVVSSLLSSGEEVEEDVDDDDEDGISILSRSLIRLVEFVAVEFSSTTFSHSFSSLVFSSAVSIIVIVVKRLSGFLTMFFLFSKS